MPSPTLLLLLPLVPYLLRLLQFLRIYFLHTSTLPSYLLPNSYALVTGASDGIGKALAHELAARGFNLVLHGRSRSKLSIVQSSILSSFPSRKVFIVLADAADSPNLHTSTASIATQLRSSLDGPLTVLVNNCGGIQPLRRKFLTFEEMSGEEIDAVIDLNARFHILLTKALMPVMCTERRRKVLIMYTGSLGGVFPGPWLTTYSPAKAFGNVFMVALGREMRETRKEVEVMGILVGKVTETAHFKVKPTVFGPSSSTMAKAALDRVGCGRLNLIGYWAHAMQFWFLQCMPEGVQTRLINGAMRVEVEKYMKERKRE